MQYHWKVSDVISITRYFVLVIGICVVYMLLLVCVQHISVIRIATDLQLSSDICISTFSSVYHQVEMVLHYVYF